MQNLKRDLAGAGLGAATLLSLALTVALAPLLFLMGFLLLADEDG